MRHLAVISAAAALSIGPATARADSIYSGCGTTFQSCASVKVRAVQQLDGTWRVSVTVWNRSHGSPNPAAGNAMLWEVALTGVQDPVTGPGAQLQSVKDGRGRDWSYYFTPQDGDGEIGVQGYSERLDDDGNVAWGRYLGAVGADCTEMPACQAQLLRDQLGARGDTTEYRYLAGPVTYTFSVSEFNTTSMGVRVGMNFVGPSYGSESFQLNTVTVTPEPVTMSLVGVGLAGVGLARRRRRCGSA